MSSIQQDQSEFNVIFVHRAIDDYPLTTEEFRVYSHIARRAGNGEAWPSVKSVALKCRIHEDTARRCLHNLIAYGLIAVTERGGQGKSNLYRITSSSNWKAPAEAEAMQEAQAQATKAKREAKKAAKADPLRNEGRGSERRDPSETKGGEGGETKGAPPSETKGDEVNPLKETPLREPKREEAPAAPALPDTQEGQKETELPQTPAADAAAPGGANEAAQPVQVSAQPTPDAEPGQATSTEKVAGGGAAAGGRSETETYLRRKLSSAFVDRVLDEVQPLGVERRRDWFALPLDRAEALVAEAQATHAQHKVKVPTRLRDLLDDECRRRNTPATPASDAAAAGKYDRSAWSD